MLRARIWRQKATQRVGRARALAWQRAPARAAHLTRSTTGAQSGNTPPPLLAAMLPAVARAQQSLRAK
jgi:hypothetical protein